MSNWNIRGVDQETRTLVRIYAAKKHLKLAQALAELVQKALIRK